MFQIFLIFFVYFTNSVQYFIENFIEIIKILVKVYKNKLIFVAISYLFAMAMHL